MLILDILQCRTPIAEAHLSLVKEKLHLTASRTLIVRGRIPAPRRSPEGHQGFKVVWKKPGKSKPRTIYVICEYGQFFPHLRTLPIFQGFNPIEELGAHRLTRTNMAPAAIAAMN